VACLLPEAVLALEVLEIGLEPYRWSSSWIEVLALCLYLTNIWLWVRYPKWTVLVTMGSCWVWMKYSMRLRTKGVLPELRCWLWVA
jgi:hypothetical protein